MITIPTELIEQVERRNVLLFVGERILRDGSGRVIVDQLTTELAGRVNLADADTYSFAEIAQIYDDEQGRQGLVQFLRQRLEQMGGDEPQPVHRLIARMSCCDVLATTCYDRRLERAFEEVGRPVNMITGDIDIAFEEGEKAQIYKLRGALERPETLVLTEDDYESFFDDQASISLVLQSYLARKTILFIGYDLADPAFKRLYRKAIGTLDNYARRAYAFGEAPPPAVSRWSRRHGIQVVEADATAFLEALTAQLAARARSTSATPRQPSQEPAKPLPQRPYKLLDYYEPEDVNIFYGRRREILELTALVHAHRLVVLYGASGVGKTSLLLAGVVPLIEGADPPYEAMYVRALEDPAQVMRHMLQRHLPDAGLPSEGSLVDLLNAAVKALGRPLVLMVDQFEEFFIRLSPQFRAAFIAELGKLYDARDVPVKIVLCLREDWLASVDEIEQRIPEVMRTRMRLLPLTRDQARQAITAPVELLGVHYETELVDHLLDDLVHSEGTAVMPPQLQLVCSALYDGLAPTERLITLPAYQQLGGARGVLRRYLEDELARLDRDQRLVAQAILEELVTSQGTKAVKTSQELSLALGQHSVQLAPVLQKLVGARLLRVLERSEKETSYELAHEYLIGQLDIGMEAKQRKEAEELIRQEVDNWKRFGTLLPGDKLALVSEARALLRLSPEAQEVLVRSALQLGYDEDYWLDRVADPTQRMAILTDATQSRLVAVRQRSATLLGTQDTEGAVAPLILLAVYDDNPSVRVIARESLGHLTAQCNVAASQLSSMVDGADRTTQQRILEALTALPLKNLPISLKLRVLATKTRLQITWLVKASTATPARRAILLTAGMLVLLIALAYVAASGSYYVHVKPSEISNELDVVVRRGFSWLPLPGLTRSSVERVNTGVSGTTAIAKDRWKDANDGRYWGFWNQNSQKGYRKWGQDVSALLSLEYRLPLQWYLDPERPLAEELFQELWPDPKSQVWRAQALGQVAIFDPDLAPRATEVLVKILEDDRQSKLVHSGAALSLAHLVALDPQLASEDMLDVLLERLPESKESMFASDRFYGVPLALGEVVLSRAELLSGTDVLSDESILEALVDTLDEGGYWPNPTTVDVLGKLATGNRTIGPKVLDYLSNVATDNYADEYRREMVIAALQAILDSNPGLALPIAKLSAELIASESPAVSSGSIYTLRQALKYRPNLEDQVIDELNSVLTQRILEKNDKAVPAAAALAELLTIYPDLTAEDTSDPIVALTEMMNDPTVKPSLRVAAAGELLGLPQTNSAPLQRFSTNAVHVLLQVVIDKTMEQQTRAEAIWQLQHADADHAVTASDVKKLVELMADESDDDYLRSDVAWLLATTQQPSLHSDANAMEAIDTLIKLMIDEANDSNVRSNAGWNLTDALDSSPALITKLPTTSIDTLQASLTDYDIEWAAGKALTKIYTQHAFAAKNADFLYAALVDPRNPQGRSIAAKTLFLLFLRRPEPSRNRAIVEHLEALSSSREPLDRIWANTTLQMLYLATQAQKAASQPSERAKITERLSLLTYGDYHNFDQGQVTYIPLFFEFDAWAATESLTWLQEQIDRADEK